MGIFVGVIKKSCKVVGGVLFLHAVILTFPLIIFGTIAQYWVHSLSEETLSRTDSMEGDDFNVANVIKFLKYVAKIGAMELGTLLLISFLWILAQSVVSYTVAFIHLKKKPLYSRTILAVLRSSKRLFITFGCSILILLAASFYMLIISISMVIVLFGEKALLYVSVLLLVVFVVGLTYFTLVVKLAYMVTTLGEHYGFAALAESSRILNDGKERFAALCLMLLGSLAASTIGGFYTGDDLARLATLTISGYYFGFCTGNDLALFPVAVLGLVVIFSMVAQSIFYLMLKEKLGESVDNSLSYHLGDLPS